MSQCHICPHCNYTDTGADTFIDSSACPQCGGAIELDELQVVSAPNRALLPQARIGKFRLIETVGEGAYGIVWKGEDVELGRTVAVKLLHSSLLARKADAERFYREARAAAQLRHPGIVAVHEVAELDGVPAIISEFVDGLTLRQVISERQLDSSETAVLVAQVADALDYAHSLKVIHRDVKPGNIMVALQAGEGANTLLGSAGPLTINARAGSVSISSASMSPRARLLDFGLALREEAEATMTNDGQVLGTPSYMSPEQASGDSHRVDRRSDVYSLGVVLYEMLTGEVPFKGPSIVVLRKVIGDEPQRPRELRPSVPRDLETICLKAMSKVRESRYRTAGELAADLRRYLAGEPIEARPIGALGTIWRFCRRNPATAASISAISAILLISSIVSTRFAFLAIEARREVEQTLIDSYVSNGIQASELGHPAESLVWFAAAHDRAKDEQLVQQENAARFWSYARSAPLPQRAIAGVKNPKAMTVHPSGQFAMVRNSDGFLLLLDFNQEKIAAFPDGSPTCGMAEWTSAGDRIAIGSPGGCSVFDFPSGKNQLQLPNVGAVTALAFDPTGSYLAVADGELKIWDCQEQRFSRKPFQLRSKAFDLTFSQNGKFLAAACDFDYSRAWSLVSEDDIELVYSPAKEPGPEYELFNPKQKRPQFVGNDRYLITCPDKYKLELIDTTTWLPTRSITFPDQQQRVIEWYCTSQDQQKIAIGFFDQVLTYDVETDAFIGNLAVHANNATPGSFSADGRSLLTSCADRTCRFWSIPSGLPLAKPLFHQDEVSMAMFRPDSRSFITIQRDGLARVWSYEPAFRQLPIGGRDSFLAMSNDGKYCIGAGVNLRHDLREPQLHHLESFESITTLPLNIDQAQLYNAAFSPDSQHVVLLCTLPSDQSSLPATSPANAAGLIMFFDVVDGQRSKEPIATSSRPVGAAFSDDGQWLAVVCAGNEILLIDNKHWRVEQRLVNEGEFNGNFMLRDFVRFCPNDSKFITWGAGFKARVWDAKSGQQLCEIDAKEIWFSDIQFSHCGKMFAAASYNKTARVYDALNGEPISPALVHPDWVFTLRFSPDDKHLLTACRDGKGRLWDWRAMELACTTMNHDDELFDVSFANAGKLILTACRDGSARVWNARSGKPISPPLSTEGYCYRARVTPDNELLVLASQSDSLKVYSLPRLAKPEGASDGASETSLMRKAEIISGARLETNGGIENLTTAEWFDRWRAQ